MKLGALITQYIEYRRSLGEKFKTNAAYLKYFCRFIGESTAVNSITATMVDSFLYSDSKAITSGWFIRHTAILGFYQYALSRNYVDEIPLPKVLPKRPEAFVAYVYSKAELKCLFVAALNYQKLKSHIEPRMVRDVLFLTYALGLRPHEAMSIKLKDIDLAELIITINDSKFYKSRLVPFNQQVKTFLDDYLEWRNQQKQSLAPDASLFMTSKGIPFNQGTMNGIFERVRLKSGIKRTDNTTFQPRWHDLRHTFAVNRLISWYQEHKDVQQLLPILSTYMGHTQLVHTSVYLTMTDKLLQESNMKFEQYVFTGEQQ